MTSYLEILKSLQYSQKQERTLHNQQTHIQTQVQPDLNLYEFGQSQHSYSFIEYVPFQRKVIQMEERIYKQKVPKTKIVTYEVEQFFVENVPKQITVTDYFAVQHLRYYKKQIIPQKTIEYVPVVRTLKKKEYVPVERKIIHYPKDLGSQKLKNIDDQELTPSYRATEKKIQNQRTQRPFFPIKEFIPQDSDYEQKENKINESSLFQSLSKAYTPEPSTQYGSNKRYTDPVSPFQTSRRRRPSTFREVDYRSTETIDSRYFMNL